MKKTSSLIFGLIFFICLPVFASNTSKLYKDYTFGMLKSEIQNQSQVFDCSKEFGKDYLCLDNQKFANVDVGLAFEFLDDKLVRLSLLSESTDENYMQIMGALNSKFQLIQMEDNDKKIDFVEQLKTSDKSAFIKKVSEFEEKAIKNGNITYSFIEKIEYNKLFKKSSNAVELIYNSKLDTRFVNYSINKVDEKSSICTIQFTAPNRVNKILKEKSKHKYEDY